MFWTAVIAGDDDNHCVYVCVFVVGDDDQDDYCVCVCVMVDGWSIV